MIGSDNYFLTAEQQGNVHDCIAMLLDMGALLHLEEYNEQAISQLDANCLRLLSNCKTTFAGFSKSNFKFKKVSSRLLAHGMVHNSIWGIVGYLRRSLGTFPSNVEISVQSVKQKI